jgi:hypothetical protein
VELEKKNIDREQELNHSRLMLLTAALEERFFLRDFLLSK